MFLRPANPYDLNQRHNRPDKRGLLPFSHRLQPQPGKKLQPSKQPQQSKKPQPGLQIEPLNHTIKKLDQDKKKNFSNLNKALFDLKALFKFCSSACPKSTEWATMGR